MKPLDARKSSAMPENEYRAPKVRPLRATVVAHIGAIFASALGAEVRLTAPTVEML